ncbi:hypothetical protein BKA61DRAFT_185534 [Leptodontidium sp. MPI-SDFR-AT-0119]|nr:hypothetical protein BKA61DRAFT_185534 [Leptodontidium sp. MPI-SDFR-AT-0119]
MEHSVTPLSSALGEIEANMVGERSNHGDAEANLLNKQRRKIQNRKNQRAHRLRIREQDPGSVQISRPFEVMRWHIDELGDCPPQDASLASKGAIAMSTSISPEPPHTRISTLMFTPEHTGVLPGPPDPSRPTAPVHGHFQTSLTPPSLIFPLSTDHLLHLVQYNVFRAFVSNKSTLNILLTGWTDYPPSPTTCPISGPYRDNTMVYPLNPNIPFSLFPTRLQQTCLHSFWINLFPFPTLRDNLIRRDGKFDHWELLADLIGELMGSTPFEQRQGTPVAITVSDPKNMSASNPPPTEGSDEDEVTAGRKGLIVWGEPYDMRSWEATPGFIAKWSWAVEGCYDLVESSNHWRLLRGEEPIRLPELKE